MASSSSRSSSSSTTSITPITDQNVISAFNRGPLLTTYTPPTSCVSTYTFGTVMYFGHNVESYIDPACYPSSTTEYGNGQAAWYVYYYSPGVCPEGYATATTFTSSWGRSNTLLAIGSDTTVALCCPSKFSYASDGHACVSTFSSITSKLTYINPQLNAINQWVSTSASPPLITTASGDPYHIYGDGIPIMWQESDLKAFAEAATATPSTATTISTSLSAGLPAQTASTTASTNTTTTLPKPTSAPTLSTGAKIAIGLVVPGIVIAVVAAVAIWFIRKRKRGRNAALELGVDGEQGSRSQMMMMMGEQGKFDPDRKGGFEGNVRSELVAEQPVVELYGAKGTGNKKEIGRGTPMELAA
ncbi:hypothetical protein ACMFMG_000042 [Clarireedia jacksonii]